MGVVFFAVPHNHHPRSVPIWLIEEYTGATTPAGCNGGWDLIQNQMAGTFLFSFTRPLDKRI